jgi:branched-chain amino acid aminotransferase
MHRRRHAYPAEETYWNGVAVGTMPWSRVKPGEKAVRPDYKKAVAEKLSRDGPYGRYYETLLVAADGRVTEGSRSNAFFLDREAGVLRTAPDADVLLGVTRRHVIEAVRHSFVPIRFEAVTEAEVLAGRHAAVFLSGTSIGVLPVSSVEGTRLESARDETVARIRSEYDRIVSEYIRTHRGGPTP